MMKVKNKSKALYIHIPFCDHICSYCDFPKLLSKTNFEKSYLDALIKEMESYNIDSLDTIFIGGGTPTALNNEDLEKLLSYIHQSFNNLKEFSIEANPESLTRSKLDLLTKYGVTRISIGVQTFDEKLLKLLNRRHLEKDVIRLVKSLKDYSFHSFNLDFIYGIPYQTFEMFKTDVEKAIALNSDHLSFYPLQIEEGTLLANQQFDEPDNDLLADEYNYLVKRLREAGYDRYEVSNFAKKGYECLHNLTYWHNDDYYAAGLGATSKLAHDRVKRTLSITKYMAGDYYSSTEIESLQDSEFNYLMLNLRLTDGFLRKDFIIRYGEDFLIKYSDTINNVKEYLAIDEERVRVKEEFIYILDSILVDLLHFKED